MIREQFERLVREAILELPKHIRQKMENVAIVIEDYPTPIQQKKSGVWGRSILLGLYEGVPKTKRGPGYTLVLPDKITIFQKSIEAIAATPDEIKKQACRTVWHEIAHHFGMDEERVRRMEAKRCRKS